MSVDPILLVGGSGVVGRRTAQFLQEAHPDVPLLIGGRDRSRAEQVAAEFGNAEGVVIDLAADDLGLGARAVAAVAVLLMDERAASLRFAQARGVGHISISPGIVEMGPEVAAFSHRPNAAPVVLGTEWLVGATTVPTLAFAEAFGRVDTIAIGALLDQDDTGGPAQSADLERQTATMPAALARHEGRFVWRVGADAKTSFRAVDGTEMEAIAFSPYDVVALATATGAPDVRFALASGVSSSRRRGEPLSTEIVIQIEGQDHTARPLRTRHAVVHAKGQFPLTGLGVAMILERLAGCDGSPPPPPGLYFPYQLLNPASYFARLEQAGGVILELEAP